MLFEALLEENKREESEKTFLFRRKKPFQDTYMSNANEKMVFRNI